MLCVTILLGDVRSNVGTSLTLKQNGKKCRNACAYTENQPQAYPKVRRCCPVEICDFGHQAYAIALQEHEPLGEVRLASGEPLNFGQWSVRYRSSDKSVIAHSFAAPVACWSAAIRVSVVCNYMVSQSLATDCR